MRDIPHRRRPLAFALSTVTLLVALAVFPASAGAFGYDHRSEAMNTAVAQLGKPYVWAAAGPRAFDCSGLVSYCLSHAGISVPHQSGMIYEMCEPVKPEELEPGDLVFGTKSGGAATSSASINHIGLYMGGGKCIHASSSVSGVAWTDLSHFKSFGRLKTAYWPRSERSYDPPLQLRADVTGDGRDDLVNVVALPNGSTRIVVYPARGTTFGPAATWWTSAHGGWDWHHTKAVAGDFDGNGKDDVALVYDAGNSTTLVQVSLSGGTKFISTRRWWTSGAHAWSWDRTKVVAGDFDGNGRDDIAMMYDYDGTRTKLWGLFSNGGTFGGATLMWDSGIGHWSARNTKLAAGDLNGDGRGDIAMLYDYGRGTSKLWTLLSAGRNLRLAGCWWAPAAGTWTWTRTKLALADVSGDRRADVVLFYDLRSRTSKLTVLTSTGTGLRSPADWWAASSGGFDWQRARLGVGDFDGDKVADVAGTYDYGGGRVKLWTWRSTRSALKAPAASWDSGAGACDWNRLK